MASHFLIEGPGGIPQIKMQGGYRSALPITTTGTTTTGNLVLTSTTCTLPAGTTVGGSSMSALSLGTVTSSGSGALVVGANGATNPVLNIDASVSSVKTGLNIQGEAAGSGLQVSVISSQANESMQIDAAGTGNVQIGTLNAGETGLAVGSSTTVTTAVLNVTSSSANALTVGRQGATNPALKVSAVAGTSVTGLVITANSATNGLALSTGSSGGNESLTLDAKGTGTVGINTVGTSSGVVTLGNGTSLAGIAVNGPAAITGSLTSLEPVVAVTASTSAPTQAQSGTTFTLSRAAGITVTLPTPVVGTFYQWIVITSVTSNSYKIITSAGSVYMQGVDNASYATAGAGAMFQGNGTSHISFNCNGTTTGGLIGTTITAYCLTATLWHVVAQNFGSGTLATSFGTS